LPSSLNVSGGLASPPICEYHRPFPLMEAAEDAQLLSYAYETHDVLIR
jgi:hypothetical protein